MTRVLVVGAWVGGAVCHELANWHRFNRARAAIARDQAEARRILVDAQAVLNRAMTASGRRRPAQIIDLAEHRVVEQ